MDASRAPAVAHAAAFGLGVATSRALALPPRIAASALLVALGIALGRRPGRWLASCAVGAMLALAAAPEVRPVAGHIGSALGRVGSRVRASDDGSRVDLLTERLSQPGVGGGRAPSLQLHFPAGAPVPPAGSRIRVRGPLSRAPGYANERGIPPGPWRLRLKSPRFVERLAPPPPLARLAAACRRRAREAFERAGRGAPGPGLRVARALLLGEPEALDESWARSLRRCGLGHLTAVSGFHVSLVVLIALLATAPAVRSLRHGVVAASILAYLALVGGSASVLRATATALLAVLGLAWGRVQAAGQALALVFVLLLAERPERLGEPGFRLSFAATAGLVAWAPRWSRRWSRQLPRPLALALAATLAAQAGSLPFSVAAFGEVAPAAPLFNLLAAPWAAVTLACGIVWLGLATLLPSVGTALAPALDPLAAPLEALTRLPPSRLISISWPGGWPAGSWVALALVAIGEGGRLGRCTLIGLALLLQTGHGPAPPGAFELLALDVGQGDALLLRRGPVALLIDGGGGRGREIGRRVVRPALADRGITRLTAALVTHTDADHCRGLVETVSEVPVEEIWAGEGILASDCVRELSAASGRRVVALAAGRRLVRGELVLDVLHPGSGTAPPASNASSLVAAVSAGGRRILLTGDIGAAEEARLVLGAREALRCDLLKVPHHGSAASSTLPFLAAARPRLALVSAGVRNPYGHPSGAALDRYRRLGIRVLRTDRDGGVSIRWRSGSPLDIRLPSAPRLAQ